MTTCTTYQAPNLPDYLIQVYDYVTDEIDGSTIIVQSYKQARIKRRAICRQLRAGGWFFLGVRIIRRGMNGDKIVCVG